MMRGMPPPTLLVRRAAFSIDDPWGVPPSCEVVPLRRATDGAPPRLQTNVIVFADDECLNVLFQSQDDGVVATHLRHDAPLYEEDVFEVFLSPAELTRYYEIEVNPLGTTFDARIDSPEGTRANMHAHLGWECANLFAAVRKTPEAIDTILRIPFASLDRRRPAAGEQWRGNFFRVDRSAAHGDEFSAWQPTMRTPADFHITAAFGRIVFA